jgi:hypothetical protein
MMSIGKLERVPLKELWKHEAHGFSAWLSENLEVLGEQIDYPLTFLEKEKPVGAFAVDLYAEGVNGEMVVIENQLAATDHDHLGKVLVYLSNLEAKTAIWISANPRPEHKTAIEWLNETCPADTSFFLVKLEAYQISGSKAAAPLFTVVSGPSKEVRDRGKKKDELGERQLKRHSFWQQLLEKARATTKLHANVSPSHDSWIGTGAGRSGLQWTYTIRGDSGAVELYIDRGPDRKDETDAVFESLNAHKRQIEKAFGEPLIWDQVAGRRGVRIQSRSQAGGWKDEKCWKKLQEDMVKRMVRLERTLNPHVRKLDI